MELGMYTGEINRNSPKDLFKAIRNYGFTQIQLDLLSIGANETMPENIDISWAKNIADEAARHGIKIIAVTGTFNMAHPNPAKRQEGLERLKIMAAACKAFSSSLVTLCTGSRNMGNPFDVYKMWVRNPENDTSQAWKDMYETMKIAIKYADEYGVYMGVEPEEGTVVDYASKARQLLDDIDSPWLKIIFDSANLLHKGEADHMQKVFKDAFKLLGKDIILAHGKDFAAKQDIDPLSPFAPFAAPGNGILDYDTIIELLNSYGYKGGLLLHGFKKEEEIPDGVAFIRQKLTNHPQ